MDKQIHSAPPIEHVHVDHTQLDIILMDGESRIGPGRPRLSLATDPATRTIVGIGAGSQEVSHG